MPKLQFAEGEEVERSANEVHQLAPSQILHKSAMP
jgi:hypothetical protein